MSPPQKSKEQKDFFREIDLTNHIGHEDVKEDAATPSINEEIRQKLQRDNQLRSAFNILKSLVLYASYRHAGHASEKEEPSP